MTRPRSKMPKGKTASAAPNRAAGPREQLRLSAQGDRIVVWLQGKDARPKRIGSVDRRLAADARRHGQDLVGDLVDIALLEADRRQPPRA